MAQPETNGSSTPVEQSSTAGGSDARDLVLAHRDPSTGNVVFPSPVSGQPLEFRPGAKCLSEEQFMILGPLGIKREYDPAAVLNFLMDAQRRGFDPYSREIFLLLYRTRFGPQYTHHIGIHGMRRHVVGTGQYGGLEPVKFAGDDGKWLDIWPYRDATPYVCRARMRHLGWNELVEVDGYFDEFAPLVDEYIDDRKTGNKILSPMWRPGAEGGKANLMIRKCTLAMGFREGWPAMLGNWYDQAEFAKAQVENDEIIRTGAAAAAADDTATRRQRAYLSDRSRIIEGDQVGAVLLERPGDQADEMPGDRVRAMLLAERDAQAAIVGQTPAFMVARWREARGGADFNTAPLGQIAAHLEVCRSYVVTELRKQGRAEMADRYQDAQRPGTLVDMFGVDRVEALTMEKAAA